MTTGDYELTEGEAMRGLAAMIGNPELTELVEKGWWR